MIGFGVTPSILTRIFWMSQALLAIKNFESAVLRVIDDNQAKDFGTCFDSLNEINDLKFCFKIGFWIQMVAVIVTGVLGIRAFTVNPQLPNEEEYDFTKQKISMKPIRSASVRQKDKEANLVNDGEEEGIHYKTTEEMGSFFTILTFNWLSPMFTTGYKRALEMNDLNYLRERDHTDRILTDFNSEWYKRYTPQYSKQHSNELNDSQNIIDSKNETSITIPTPNRSINNSSNDNSQMKESLLKSENKKMDSQSNDPKSGDKKKVSLYRTMLYSFGGPYLLAGPLKLVYDATQYSGPIFLGLFISHAEHFKDSAHARKMGYIISGLLFLTYMFGTFVLHQYFHLCFTTGMRVRSALIGACFEKALKLTSDARSHATAGELLNYITVDVRQIRNLFPYGWMLISAPFQISMAIYLLYLQIGWTVFVGMGFQLVLMTPLQAFVAKAARKIQKDLMKIRDRRIKVVNEVFCAMKIVKMYAWEISFGTKISDIREEELNKLKCYVYWMMCMTVFWGFVPTLVTLSSFVAYIGMGHELTPTKAFTAIALFNLLRFPLAMFPNVIVAIIQANVCVRRIEKFLQLNERDPFIVEFNPDLNTNERTNNNSLLLNDLSEVSSEMKEESNGSLIKLDNCEFSWDDEGHQIALSDINCEFKKRQYNNDNW